MYVNRKQEEYVLVGEVEYEAPAVAASSDESMSSYPT